jgi:coenzyme F420 hydrogenase subunit beta
MARSTDSRITGKTQDGGVVTTLLAFALDSNMVEAVVCTKMDDNRRPHGFLARSGEELIDCAGSSYEAGFALEAFRKIPSGSTDRLAVVGVGCQMEALAKMKLEAPVNGGNPDNVQLAVGLFCGWSLRPDIFRPLLEGICEPTRIVKFDIPHSPGTSFDIYTDSEKISTPLDEIRPAINPACQYCWDMTAEFSDISVGSAGSNFPGWNTVIIRTEKGADLLARAQARGVVEVQPLPEARRTKLREAVINRKESAFRKRAEKRGSGFDLL